VNDIKPIKPNTKIRVTLYDGKVKMEIVYRHLRESHRRGLSTLWATIRRRMSKGRLEKPATGKGDRFGNKMPPGHFNTFAEWLAELSKNQHHQDDSGCKTHTSRNVLHAERGKRCRPLVLRDFSVVPLCGSQEEKSHAPKEGC